MDDKIKKAPTGSYVCDIEQLNRQLTLDEKRHFIQGVKDDEHRVARQKMIIRNISFYIKLAKLLAFSRLAYWLFLIYSVLIFAGCHVTAREELAYVKSKQQAVVNSNKTNFMNATPLLHQVGLCSKIEVEAIESSMKGFETFTIFLLISYFTTVTTRVWNMYACTVAAMGRINDIVCLSRGCYEACDRKSSDGRLFLIDIHRFCNLSWVACFVGVTEAYTVDNLFRPFSRANPIPGVSHLNMGLLSKEEFVELQTVIYLNKGGNGLRFFIKCALRTAAMAEKRGVISEQSYNVLINKIILLRAKIGTLFDYRMMPINAGYKFLVNFSTYAYLVVFVALKILTIFQSGGGITVVVTGFVTIIFLMFMIIGILTLAHELEFPFSRDGLFDHRVTNLVHGIAQSSSKILFQSPCISTEMKDIDSRRHRGKFDQSLNARPTTLATEDFKTMRLKKRNGNARRHTANLTTTSISNILQTSPYVEVPGSKEFEF